MYVTHIGYDRFNSEKEELGVIKENNYGNILGHVLLLLRTWNAIGANSWPHPGRAVSPRGIQHTNSASHSWGSTSSSQWEGNLHWKTKIKEFEGKRRQNAFPKYTPTCISSLLTVCGKGARNSMGTMKLDLPPVQLLFLGAVIHLVPLVISLSTTGSFVAYSKQWETQSSWKMNHISSYSYPKLFFALLCKSLRKTGLCFTLRAMDLKRVYFIILYLKMQTVLHSSAVNFRISGLEVRGSTVAMKSLLFL